MKNVGLVYLSNPAWLGWLPGGNHFGVLGSGFRCLEQSKGQGRPE